MRGYRAFALLLIGAGNVAHAQSLPKYEIHEAQYSDVFPIGSSWVAKVVDRVNNKLWKCEAKITGGV
jgi:hypothetical protein